MMVRAALVTVALAVSGVAYAQDGSSQSNPEEEWNTLPGEKKAPSAAPPVSVELQPPPPPSSSPRDGAPAQPVAGVSSPRPVLEPNNVSMFGGRSLGFLTRGEMFYLGFPLIGIRLSIGLLERVDLGIGFDSFYGLMNEPLATLRVNFFRGTNWNMAAIAEGGPAFFQSRASSDQRGPRWLTGRRNGNLRGGVVFSYQGDHPRAARLFLSLQYLLAFDTEPYQKDPLGGVPASLQLGHNALVRAGAEMPLSAKTSFVFLLGLDVHGRPEDSIVMPVCSVGLVTSI
ncbi:MAG: hypothetical protein JNK82_35630 [Myxococcaceae bacterium]|nr:hypothetical protein [Myxococcaceae bacterium]